MSKRILKKSVALILHSEPAVLRRWVNEELVVPAVVGSIDDAHLILAQTIPDIIFVEDKLAAGFGNSFISEVRKSPHHQDIPVILITSSNDPHMLERAVMSGIYACLKNPLQEEECKGFLRKALTGRTGRVER